MKKEERLFDEPLEKPVPPPVVEEEEDEEEENPTIPDPDIP